MTDGVQARHRDGAACPQIESEEYCSDALKNSITQLEFEKNTLKALIVECKALIGVPSDIDTLTDISLRIDAAIDAAKEGSDECVGR